MNNTIKNAFIYLGIFIIIFTTLSCAGGAAAQTAGSHGNIRITRNISEIQDRNWILEEARVNNIPVQIDRAFGGHEIFTLRLETDRISGVGAPNRYFAPYTSGQNNTLSIGMIAGTLMAPLFEPEGLREHEYYAYLGNAESWDIVNGNLELYSRDVNGNPVVLIFN